MRRKDKEISDRALIEQIIKKADVCRIAVSQNDRPYIVPMNFGYEDNCIYLHTINEGKKIDILKKNEHVCFEMDIECHPIEAEKPCDWSMNYYSVVGYGRAVFMENNEQKIKGLDVIVGKYTGKSSFDYPEAALESLAIIRIEIDSMTGKKSNG